TLDISPCTVLREPVVSCPHRLSVPAQQKALAPTDTFWVRHYGYPRRQPADCDFLVVPAHHVDIMEDRLSFHNHVNTDSISPFFQRAPRQDHALKSLQYDLHVA